jgi:hypothetical protein
MTKETLLEMTKPPRTTSIVLAKHPKVLAVIRFRAQAANNLNKPEAAWLINANIKS